MVSRFPWPDPSRSDGFRFLAQNRMGWVEERWSFGAVYKDQHGASPKSFQPATMEEKLTKSPELQDTAELTL